MHSSFPNGIYQRRGVELEQGLKDRARIQSQLEAVGKEIQNHRASGKRLDRKIRRIIVRARNLNPPMTQVEIARLVKLDQSQVSRITNKERERNGINRNHPRNNGSGK